MGQSQTLELKAPNLSKQGYHIIRQPPLRSLSADISIYQKGDNFLSHAAYPLDSKSSQLLLQNNRYYSERAAVAHPNLIALSFCDFVETANGLSVKHSLGKINVGSEQANKKTNVNALCSLNIFQQNCQKGMPANTSSLLIKLHLYHEYQGHTLQSQIEMRKQCEVLFHEKQLWTLIAIASSAGKAMVQNGFKEPLLSPNTIKIDCRSHFKVGQWQFTHFYEDLTDDEEETNFYEEGQTFLKPSSSRVGIDKSKHRKKGYNVLTNYYWAPEGTAGLQNIVTLGRKGQKTSINDSKPTNNQIFSLGMTILHICLMRPLYQSETFSQKRINSYIKQAISLRDSQGMPLSNQLIKLLEKMLAWDAQDRIAYSQLNQQAVKHSTLRPAESIFTTESDSPMQSGTFRSRKLNPTKSLLFVEGNGSGIVNQGEGDTEHPLEQSQKMNIPCTIRSQFQTADYSLNYGKIDITIKRERREWERFENRIEEDSYKVKPNNNPCSRQLFPVVSTFSFPAETLLEDGQDNPNSQNLCGSTISITNEKQHMDFEYQPPCDINCTSSIQNSIKLLDISNIKAQDDTKEVSKHRHSFIKIDVPQNDLQQSYSNLFMENKNSVEIIREDSMLLKSSIAPIPTSEAIKNDKEESIFTPPELLALIRSSVYSGQSRNSHKSPKNSSIPQQQPSQTVHFNQLPMIASQNPVILSQNLQEELSNSVFVKESFAKGFYEGGKMDGLRSGYGTFYYNEGGKYCGDWDNNQMHGKGTLYYADGRIAYQGDWSHDALKGKGILYNQNPIKLDSPYDYSCFDQSQDYWVYYEGSFHNDDKWGRGVLLLSNGEKYEGNFRNDLIDGRGVFYTMGGKKIIGEWQGNHLVKVIKQEVVVQ